MVLSVSLALGCTNDQPMQESANIEISDDVNEILSNMHDAIGSLETYRCSVAYLFSQPLFDSKTLRLGQLVYRYDPNGSTLRMTFTKLQQDDQKIQNHKEEFLFDGVWLTHVDYQTEHVSRYQQADPNRPINVFELMTREFPMVGFLPTETIQGEFKIQLVEEAKESTQLHLDVRPQSVYAQKYSAVDVWIDNKHMLPTHIVATSTEDEIYDIRFEDIQINPELKFDLFEIDIPDDFTVQVKPLEKSESTETMKGRAKDG